MVVLSEIGRKISIKTEAASSSMKPFEEQPVEHEEEASRRKCKVIGTDIETEYEEMDTEEEESEVRKLTKRRIRNVPAIQGILHSTSKDQRKNTQFWLYT